jgi:hypothetical protein
MWFLSICVLALQMHETHGVSLSLSPGCCRLNVQHSGYCRLGAARMSLHLRDWPVEALDLDVLARSREAIPTPRHGPTPADEEEEPTRSTEPWSSQTERGRKPRCPRDAGDDPFILGDLDDDTQKKKELRVGLQDVNVDTWPGGDEWMYPLSRMGLLMRVP